MTGLDVCRIHGGKAPQVQAAAARRAEATRNAELVRRTLADAYGDDVPAVDPAEAMLQAVSWKFAEVVALRAKVAQLEDEERVWGVTEELRKGAGEWPGTDTTSAAVPNAWWVMLRSAEDQLVAYAKAARAAGCDERRVQLAESQGSLVAGVIERILARLVLSEAQRALVPTVVPEELRLLGPAEAVTR